MIRDKNCETGIVLNKQVIQNRNATTGITLIALAITIIILLILAGVTIAMLTGENGILNKANLAKTETEQAKINEEEKLKDAKGILEIQTKEVPIPSGFYFVGGSKESGLVISDKKQDENKGVNLELIGNQYVWIPVDKATFNSKFKRTEGYYNGLPSPIEDCGEVGADGINDSGIEESLSTKNESINMYKSVKVNGGFYIARYEAGYEDGNVVSKKGVNIFNNIPWSNSNEMNTDTGGAVEKARGVASQNGYTSVKSTLCYGVQWDAAMNFIDNNHITNETEDGKPNCDTNSYLVNSMEKGNYSGSLKQTGSDINYQTKNIYDMAGNIQEWTMESRFTNSRVLRGGYYYNSNSEYSIASRANSYPNDSYSSNGFRYTLYIEDSSH